MRYFTADWTEHATLRDGTAVQLRLVAPTDRDMLRRGFDLWSQASRYARFLGPKQALSEDELTYLVELDQEQHFAIGALLDGEQVGLGIARFIRLPFVLGEAVTAEAAVAVADEAHGKGLGKLLLLRLCAAAAERDIEQFRCEVLGDNTAMHALIGAVSSDLTMSSHDGVTTIDFPITAIAPDAPRDEPGVEQHVPVLSRGGGERRRLERLDPEAMATLVAR